MFAIVFTLNRFLLVLILSHSDLIIYLLSCYCIVKTSAHLASLVKMCK